MKDLSRLRRRFPFGFIDNLARGDYVNELDCEKSGNRCGSLISITTRNTSDPYLRLCGGKGARGISRPKFLVSRIGDIGDVGTPEIRIGISTFPTPPYNCGRILHKRHVGAPESARTHVPSMTKSGKTAMARFLSLLGELRGSPTKKGK